MKATHKPVISSTGLFTPAESISNEELVESFNAYVAKFNADNADAIAAGEVEVLAPSSVEFIEKASGIKARHVMAKEPVLDVDTMAPRWPERSNDELSMMAEIGVKAAKQALEAAGRDVKDVDAVILCTGYKHHFPFLPSELRLECPNVLATPDLYKGVAYIHNPKVFYLGMQDQWYTFNMFDAQAWWVRDAIMGRISIPGTAMRSMIISRTYQA